MGKRLTKSPKVYVRDSGLLHALLGLGDLDALRRHPKLGASWEGFVLEQVTGALALLGDTPSPFFWRTHGGAEVDLLLELEGRLLPIEIKLSGAPVPGRGLVECMRDLSLRARFVIHGGHAAFPLGRRLLPCQPRSRRSRSVCARRSSHRSATCAGARARDPRRLSLPCLPPRPSESPAA